MNDMISIRLVGGSVDCLILVLEVWGLVFVYYCMNHEGR